MFIRQQAPAYAHKHGVYKMRLIKLLEAFARRGVGISKGYELIRSGTFPAPIKDGRSSLELEYEVDQVNAAVAAGYSDEELRGLVAELVSKRAELLQTKAA
jgi:prophage regulatory protein